MKKIKDFLKRYKQSLLLRNKAWVLIFTISGILFDIFIFRKTSDLTILLLSALWILNIWLYNFEERVSFAGCLILLFLCPFLLIFNKELIAEKSAIWAYVFLVIGVSHGIFAKIKKQ